MEMIVVVGIVAAAALAAGRSFYRSVTGKNEGCGCTGKCATCALKRVAGKEQGEDFEK